MRKQAYFGAPIDTDQPVAEGLRIGVDVLPVLDGKLVGVRWHRPRHGFPASQWWDVWGVLRFSEHPEEAARRELSVQLGLGASDLQLVHVGSALDAMRDWHLFFVFVARAAGKPVPSSEITAVESFPLDRLPEEYAWWKKGEVTQFLATQGIRSLPSPGP